MKARIKWNEGASFIAESGSGHAIVIDGAPDAGGRNIGPRPMELVLMGTAACSAFDVVLILRKGRQDVVDCIAEAEAQRAETDPKVFTRIHIHFVVTGRNLDQEKWLAPSRFPQKNIARLRQCSPRQPKSPTTLKSFQPDWPNCASTGSES